MPSERSCKLSGRNLMKRQLPTGGYVDMGPGHAVPHGRPFFAGSSGPTQQAQGASPPRMRGNFIGLDYFENRAGLGRGHPKII